MDVTPNSRAIAHSSPGYTAQTLQKCRHIVGQGGREAGLFPGDRMGKPEGGGMQGLSWESIQIIRHLSTDQFTGHPAPTARNG